MRDMTRFWKWMAGLLTLLNLALLITIWKAPAAHGPPLPDFGPAKRIIHELNFNENQVSNYNKLVEEHRAAMRKLRDEGGLLRNNYFELLKEEHPADSTITLKLAAIARNQEEIEKVTFNHFREVREICTPDQKKKFDEMILDVLRAMGKPKGPPHERP